jgi:hypothetical protein
MLRLVLLFLYLIAPPPSSDAPTSDAGAGYGPDGVK